MVAAAALLLPLADQIFEGVLQFARWLFIESAMLAEASGWFHRWAVGLLGGQPWRNSKVAAWLLGWDLSGGDRTVRAAALRRAKLWMLDDHDFYKKAILLSSNSDSSWCSQSLSLLQGYSLDDW